jgi:hypothetical protein
MKDKWDQELTEGDWCIVADGSTGIDIMKVQITHFTQAGNVMLRYNSSHGERGTIRRSPREVFKV